MKTGMAGQHPVDLPAPRVFPALARLFHAGIADLRNKGKTHVGDGGASIQTALFFHLQRDMFQSFLFVLIKRQLIDDQPVPLDRFAGGKTHRDARCLRMVFDQMYHRVQTAVYGAAMFVFVAEILSLRLFLILCDVDRVVHQLLNALVFGRGDRHDRDAQHRLHGVYIHRAAVADHFIHHVQRHHNGDIHFKQLHGQIHVPLDIGNVDDVDDALRLLVQDKVAGDQLLA